MSSKSSKLDGKVEEVKQLIEQGLTNYQIGDAFGVSEATVRRFRKHPELKDVKPNSEPLISFGEVGAKNKPERPGATVGDDAATVVSKLSFAAEVPDPESLQLMHGLVADEWEQYKSVCSWWGDPLHPQGQLKLWLRRKQPLQFILPGRMPATYVAPTRPVVNVAEPILGVVCGDGQVPHNDKGQESCFLQFLEDMQPHELTDVGDQGDNPSVSTHAKNPEWHVPINECIQATTELNYYRRRACETMIMRVLMGNHDIRLKNLILAKMEALYGIKQGTIPGDEEYAGSVLDWAYLTQADRLGIEVIGEGDDNYFHGEITLAEPEDGFGLTAEHGDKTGPNAGLKTIERLTHSVMFGHTHTQEMRTKTIYDINGDPRTIYVVNVGTQSLVKGGLGYTKKPNWVNGFATYMKWPDGRFTIEFAKYENGELFWRDRRWRANV